MEHEYVASAPLKQHFGTNYAPTRRERAEIASFLPSPRAQLLELSAKIDELRAQQSTLEQTINSLEALRSPIRQIPLEIMQEIFHHCLPTKRLPALDNSEAPLLLTRVCQAWRALAQGMPSLWSRIRIVVPTGSEEHVDFHQGRIERWLACTKSAPLTISLWSKAGIESELDGELGLFCSAILSHSNHIHTLDLDVADSVLETLLEPTKTKRDPAAWPLLHKVVLARALAFVETYGYTDISPRSLYIWKAPNLKHITWNSVSDDALLLETNWAQLESFEVWWEDDDEYENKGEAREAESFSMLPPRDLRRALHHAPNLAKLKIRIAGSGQASSVVKERFPIRGMPETLVLEHLTKLDLWDADVATFTTPTFFLHKLQLPALEDLTYTNSSVDASGASLPPIPSRNDAHLLQFLKAQKRPVGIKKLTISANAIPRKDFLACLESIPELEQLWVGSGSENIQTNEWGDELVQMTPQRQRLNMEVMPDD